MSTNFYAILKDPADVEFDHEHHLGLRSGGWQFLFRAYPEVGITNTKTWLDSVFRATRIHDEYGREYDIDEFLEAVEACKAGEPRTHYSWTDEFGNAFSEREFS